MKKLLHAKKISISPELEVKVVDVLIIYNKNMLMTY